MSVEVEDEGDLSVFGELVDVFLDVSGLMHVLVATAAFPPPVEVIPEQIGSVVASHHSIRIRNRDHLNLVVLSQVLAFLVLGQE